MKVYVLRGIQGSGKSSVVPELIAPYRCALSGPDRAVVCSADFTHIGADGVYRFDPAKLGAGHDACKRQFLWAIQNPEIACVVVDNTNTTMLEMAPYVEMALALGHEVEVVTVECDVVTAHARNRHDVPLETVIAAYMRLVEGTRQIPPWWTHTIRQAWRPVNPLPVTA